MQNALEDLIGRIRAYDPFVDAERLTKAYELGDKAHEGQLRASGEAYFTHPISVAVILTEMHMDLDTIITALLHDTVEDCDVTLDDIEALFGANVRSLVDGVTKLTRLELQSENTKQAENLRKLVVAMSRDIRVLLVKLADRTHNMQTIESFAREDKKARIATETLDIYAPLAERVGVTYLQRELEDKAFGVLHASQRLSIKNRLEFLSEEKDNLVPRICQELEQIIGRQKIECQVFGRLKSPYSIWNKMQKKKLSMEQLADVMAFRVIVPSVEACYQALGILHQNYAVVMGRFKDYISTPKRNGYQSIHTGIIGPLNQKIEIQIRTPEMHDTAERGVAAHWNYKTINDNHTTGSAHATTDNKDFGWVQHLVDLFEDANPEEYLEHTKLEMYKDRVFCFTPRGDLIDLPSGATAVDFAYAVHSKIGDKCVGVVINQKNRQLATELENGDVVQILTDKDASPKAEWEDFVKTGRAKSAIRRFVKHRKLIEFSRVGRALLEREYRFYKKEFVEADIAQHLSLFGITKLEELYADIAEGRRAVKDVFYRLHPDSRDKQQAKDAMVPAKQSKIDASESFEIGDAAEGMAVHVAKCCYPLPGEEVVGIMTAGKGLTVHGRHCMTLRKFVAAPELWMPVKWQKNEAKVQIMRIKATVIHEPGALAALCAAIGQLDANITNIQSAERDLNFFTFIIELEVRNSEQGQSILAALGSNEYVESVSRDEF